MIKYSCRKCLRRLFLLRKKWTIMDKLPAILVSLYFNALMLYQSISILWLFRVHCSKSFPRRVVSSGPRGLFTLTFRMFSKDVPFSPIIPFSLTSSLNTLIPVAREHAAGFLQQCWENWLSMWEKIKSSIHKNIPGELRLYTLKNFYENIRRIYRGVGL